MPFDHPFSFDPCNGYSLNELLTVEALEAPQYFAAFWQPRYLGVIGLAPQITLGQCFVRAGFKVYEIKYRSTDDLDISGWLLEPEQQTIKQCIIVGHGCGSRKQPDYHFNIPETAFLFPCFRGLSLCRHATFPNHPDGHVIHGIDDPGRYILEGVSMTYGECFAYVDTLSFGGESDRVYGYQFRRRNRGTSAAVGSTYSVRPSQCAHFRSSTITLVITQCRQRKCSPGLRSNS